MANGTINRDLSVLKRGYSLARQSTPPKVVMTPYIPMLTATAGCCGTASGGQPSGTW